MNVIVDGDNYTKLSELLQTIEGKPKNIIVLRGNDKDINVTIPLENIRKSSIIVTILDVPPKLRAPFYVYTYAQGYLKACTECGISGTARNLLSNVDAHILSFLRGYLDEPTGLTVFTDNENVTVDLLEVVFPEYTKFDVRRSTDPVNPPIPPMFSGLTGKMFEKMMIASSTGIPRNTNIEIPTSSDDDTEGDE